MKQNIQYLIRFFLLRNENASERVWKRRLWNFSSRWVGGGQKALKRPSIRIHIRTFLLTCIALICFTRVWEVASHVWFCTLPFPDWPVLFPFAAMKVNSSNSFVDVRIPLSLRSHPTSYCPCWTGPWQEPTKYSYAIARPLQTGHNHHHTPKKREVRKTNGPSSEISSMPPLGFWYLIYMHLLCENVRHFIYKAFNYFSIYRERKNKYRLLLLSSLYFELLVNAFILMRNKKFVN